MKGFKQFFEETECDKNIRDTLKKIPTSHKKFIKNYKFKWESGNVLQGDSQHIGEINPKTKTITIAAPYNYGREFTFLHELAHAVWAAYMTAKLKKEWEIVVKKNKNRDEKENDEENFAHAYANHYANNKISKHDCKEWDKFIAKIIKLS